MTHPNKELCSLTLQEQREEGVEVSHEDLDIVLGRKKARNNHTEVIFTDPAPL